MIRLKVREVAQERGITTIKAFAARAGLAYDTAADLWHGRMKRLDLATLERVCRTLQCRVEEVIELTEDRGAHAVVPAQRNQRRGRGLRTPRAVRVVSRCARPLSSTTLIRCQ